MAVNHLNRNWCPTLSHRSVDDAFAPWPIGPQGPPSSPALPVHCDLVLLTSTKASSVTGAKYCTKHTDYNTVPRTQEDHCHHTNSTTLSSTHKRCNSVPYTKSTALSPTQREQHCPHTQSTMQPPHTQQATIYFKRILATRTKNSDDMPNAVTNTASLAGCHSSSDNW